ncbi:hypothetical protein AKJ16_DCAP13122 [Drosera capensis]
MTHAQCCVHQCRGSSVYKYLQTRKTICFKSYIWEDMLHEDCITWDCDGAIPLQPKHFFRCLKELSEDIFLKDLTDEPADVSETLDGYVCRILLAKFI